MACKTSPGRSRRIAAARNSQPYQKPARLRRQHQLHPDLPDPGQMRAPASPLPMHCAPATSTSYTCCVASQVVVDGSGKIDGIDFIRYDRVDGPPVERGRVTAKLYVIAGNAIETPRLLLMSKNDGRTSGGVANSLGFIGKYLMDHPLYLAWALARIRCGAIAARSRRAVLNRPRRRISPRPWRVLNRDRQRRLEFPDRRSLYDDGRSGRRIEPKRIEQG